MSKPSEPSYYEVALTSRQVLAGFVILLACLVAAFFSGVWVGKSSPAQADPLADSRPAADAAAETGVPELEFFAGEDAPEGTAGGGAGTTLAEDLEARSQAAPRQDWPEPPPAEPGSGGGAPARGAAGVTAAEGGSGAGEEESPAARRRRERQEAAAAARQQRAGPQEEEPEPARAVPAEPAPAAPAGAAGEAGAAAGGEVFVVQVLSTRDQEKARQTLSWLRDGGYPASLSTTEQGGQLMYRVRVGPYADRSAADRMADEVRRKFKLDTWVTPE